MTIDLTEMINDPNTVWRVGDLVTHKGTGERFWVTSVEPWSITYFDGREAVMAAKKESLEDLVKAYLNAISPDTAPVSEGERLALLEKLAAAVA